ncbi:hypothetical protein [Sneathiella chinensis]|uniref:Uncharacterized protein n=1 Tax=Sneathiella chinensis TaxID=349750 RepID=A0ABQ5U6C4_9PROT|nr:hypothetical protein [Sneathiella chinensis]GLQ07712.1 hypothetical protein GCM10007924_29330 [Sneathiella chinensis]
MSSLIKRIRQSFSVLRMRSVISCGLSVLVLAAAMVSFQVTDAFAQNACFERGALVKHLGLKFSEVPVAAGLAANGSVLEVFTSEDGVTWTIVLTQPNGATCVMASGQAWMGIPVKKKEKIS